MSQSKKLEGPADLIFYGGYIFTMNDDQPTAEALAVKGDRIIAVGALADLEPLLSPKTDVIYLNSQALLPGFIEAHTHACLSAMTRATYTDVSGYSYSDPNEVLEVIRKGVASPSPESGWALFMGWDVEITQGLPNLSADYLDTYSTTVPILVVAQSGHSAWVNHKAFEIAGIDKNTPDPPGGHYVRDPDIGELTGQILEEPAITTVVHSALPNRRQLKEAIDEQWKVYATEGFTTVTELAYRPDPTQDPLLNKKAESKDCPVRLALYKVGESTEDPGIKTSAKMWLAGIKFWADGSPHCGTSAVSKPYLNNPMTEALGFPPPPTYGILNYKDKDLLGKVKKYHDQGKQVAIHAHGDRAIEQCLGIYRQLASQPGEDHRHRLEHVGFIKKSQLETCHKLGVTPSLFVYHLYFYGVTFRDYLLGESRANEWAPLASAVKYLDQISIHQDHPTTPGPVLPFANIRTAVTRTERGQSEPVFGRDECINITDALKAYTIGPAWQLHKEKEIGSLEVGKLADLVILSANPYQVDPLLLDSKEHIHVIETYTGGEANHLHRGASLKLPIKKIKVLQARK